MFQNMSEEERLRIKGNIERVLSEILSDKYDCKITLRFVSPEEKARLDAEEAAKQKEAEKNVSGMSNESVSSEGSEREGSYARLHLLRVWRRHLRGRRLLGYPWRAVL